MYKAPKIKLLILLCLVFVQTDKLFAQVTNTGSLFIATAGSVAVAGDFKNEASATYVNNGDLFLLGNFDNEQPTMAISTGTTTFRGTIDQLIRGSQPIVFNNLVVNKTAGTLTLNQNITLDATGTLTLTAGKFIINKNTITINNSATGAVARTAGYLYSEDVTLTGGKANNSSYVSWVIGNTTGAHVFPFGKSATEYIPFTYNLSSGNVGTLTLSTYASNASNTPMPIGVKHVSDTLGSSADNSYSTVDRYWNITATSSSATASMTFTYADSEVPGAGETGSDAKGLIAQQWNVNGWRYDNDPTAGVSWIAYYRNQTASAAANTVTVNGYSSALSSAMPWTLSLHAHPLPVEILSFTGKRVGGSVELDWKTATETNNSHFILKRSLDGINYEQIASVNGHGNSSIQQVYKHTDDGAPSGLVYYQLSQVDFDGTTQLIGYVSVNGAELIAGTAKFYPLPSNETLNYEITASTNCNALAEIYNVSGALAKTINIALQTGLNIGTMDFSELMNGSYFIRITGSGIQPIQQKITVLK